MSSLVDSMIVDDIVVGQSRLPQDMPWWHIMVAPRYVMVTNYFELQLLDKYLVWESHIENTFPLKAGNKSPM